MKRKRMISLILAVLMITSLLPVTGALAEGNEAQIGETPYATLELAIEAAQNGDTITLLTDVTRTMTAAGAAFTIDGKELTLNLADCDISVYAESTATLSRSSLVAFKLTNGADLTITDENSAKGGNISCEDKGASTSRYYNAVAIKLLGGSNLTVEDGIISSNGQTILTNFDASPIKASSTPASIAINLNGGEIKVDATDTYGQALKLYGIVEVNVNDGAKITGIGESIGITGNGTAGDSDTTINIYSGSTITVPSTGLAIYQPQTGTLNIEGGTITGGTGIEIKAGTLDISGGSITANGTYNAAPATNNNGSSDTGDAISIIDNGSYADQMDISITGTAALSSTNGWAVREYKTNGTTDMKKLTIDTTGTLSGGEGIVQHLYGEAGNVSNTNKVTFKATDDGIFGSGYSYTRVAGASQGANTAILPQATDFDTESYLIWDIPIDNVSSLRLRGGRTLDFSQTTNPSFTGEVVCSPLWAQFEALGTLEGGAESYFDQLSVAVESVPNGATVTLLKPIYYGTEGNNDGFISIENKSITIDLNNNSINFHVDSETQTTNNNIVALKITGTDDNQNVVIKNGEIHCINIEGGMARGIAALNGKLTLENVKVIGSNVSSNIAGSQAYGMKIENAEVVLNNSEVIAGGYDSQTAAYGIFTAHGAKLTVNDGSLVEAQGTRGTTPDYKTDKFAISGNGNPNHTDTTITINGGTVKAVNGAAIYHPQGDSTLTVKGGSIIGGTGIEIKAGTLDITGGSISADGAYAEAPVVYSNGSSYSGDAISIIDNGAYADNINVTVAGNASLSSTNGWAIREYKTNGDKDMKKLTISTSGTISGKLGRVQHLYGNYGAAANANTVTLVSAGTLGTGYVYERTADGNTAKLPSGASKADYNFLGWSDGTNTYAPGATVDLTAFTAAAPVTFTARWELSNPPPVIVGSIAISGPDSIDLGKTGAFSATVSPAMADNQTVTWSIANGTGEATIDANGVVTGVKPGSVAVIATANDAGKVSAQKTVMITSSPVTKITVSGATTLTVGDSATYTAAIEPETASDPTVEWSAVTNAILVPIASIDANGVLTATGVGTVSVIATAKDGSGITGTLDVTIAAKPVEEITPPAPIEDPPTTADETKQELGAQPNPDPVTPITEGGLAKPEEMTDEAYQQYIERANENAQQLVNGYSQLPAEEKANIPEEAKEKLQELIDTTNEILYPDDILVTDLETGIVGQPEEAPAEEKVELVVEAIPVPEDAPVIEGANIVAIEASFRDESGKLVEYKDKKVKLYCTYDVQQALDKGATSYVFMHKFNDEAQGWETVLPLHDEKGWYILLNGLSPIISIETEEPFELTRLVHTPAEMETPPEGYEIVAADGTALESPIEVPYGADFGFKVNIATGYDDTDMVVGYIIGDPPTEPLTNPVMPIIDPENVLTPDENGVYTIPQITENLCVVVLNVKQINVSILFDETVGIEGVSIIDTDAKALTSPQTVENGAAFKFGVAIKDGYIATEAFKVGYIAEAFSMVIPPIGSSDPFAWPPEYTAAIVWLEDDEDGFYTIDAVTADTALVIEGVEKGAIINLPNQAPEIFPGVMLYDEEGFALEGPLTVKSGGSIKFEVGVAEGYILYSDELAVSYIVSPLTTEPVVAEQIPVEPDEDGFFTIDNVTDDICVFVMGVKKAWTVTIPEDPTFTIEDDNGFELAGEYIIAEDDVLIFLVRPAEGYTLGKDFAVGYNTGDKYVPIEPSPDTAYFALHPTSDSTLVVSGVVKELTEGWQKGEDGFWRYAKDNEFVIGFQKLMGYKRGSGEAREQVENYYLFNDDGTLYTGFQKFEGDWYYYGEYGSDPTISTLGAMVQGWYTKTKTGYISESEQIAIAEGKVREYLYYFDADGKMYTGWHKDQLTNNKWRYFGAEGKNPTLSRLGRRYAYGIIECLGYIDAEGVAKHLYSFSKTGGMMLVDRVVTKADGNYLYTFCKDGENPALDALGSCVSIEPLAE